jgi:hypothetical protein
VGRAVVRDYQATNPEPVAMQAAHELGREFIGVDCSYGIVTDSVDLTSAIEPTVSIGPTVPIEPTVPIGPT